MAVSPVPPKPDPALEVPDWIDTRGRVNEAAFAAAFLKQRPMKCIHGRLFTVDGLVDDEEAIRREIYDMISCHVTTNLARRSTQLLEAIKLASHSAPLPIQMDRIHVANGTYFLDRRFESTKEFCLNRLPVAYNREASPPAHWLRFLDDLLESEDIPAVQEYFGYSLLPVTKAQKMLILIGKGGEGKSRVGLVLRSLLGENMNTGSIPSMCWATSAVSTAYSCRSMWISISNPVFKSRVKNTRPSRPKRPEIWRFGHIGRHGRVISSLSCVLGRYYEQ